MVAAEHVLDCGNIDLGILLRDLFSSGTCKTRPQCWRRGLAQGPCPAGTAAPPRGAGWGDSGCSDPSLWEQEMPPSTPGRSLRHWGHGDRHLWLHEEQHTVPVAASWGHKAALDCRYPRGWVRGHCWTATPVTQSEPRHGARAAYKSTQRWAQRCLPPEVPPSLPALAQISHVPAAPRARWCEAALHLLISILITTAGTAFIKGNNSLSQNANYWKNITHFKDFLHFMTLD